MSTYDEKLLAAAPEVTKADLQDGYNPDLLREPTVKRTLSARVAPTPPRSESDPHQHPMRDLESSATPLQPKEAPYDTTFSRKKTPFLRTKKGIAILALALIAIVLAAVLGGVLGSKKKGKSTSSVNGAGQASDGSNNGNEGASSVKGGAGNGAGSGPTSQSSAPPNPNQTASNTARPASTVVQGAGSTPTGGSVPENSGTTAPTTGDTGAQTGGGGRNDGSGGNGGGTGAGGSVQAPPSDGTMPTGG